MKTTKRDLPIRNTVLVGMVAFAVIAVGIVMAQQWFKAPATDPAATIVVDSVQQQLDQMTLRQKLASLLILHTPGTDPTALAEYVKKYQPGGLILMGDNIPATEVDLTKLTSAIQGSASPLPILIATDEEGCTVKRLPWDTYACAPALGALPANQTTQAFTDRSKILQAAGINLNFGIIADVTANPNAFIYPRVFGGDSKIVADHVAAAVKGSKGITLSTLKHFPGHGQTLADSHMVIPTINEGETNWLHSDALPFQSGIQAGAEVVMFGHLVYSDIDQAPASLSRKWHAILSQDLEFKGVSITDDLLMLQQSQQPEYQDTIKNTVAAIQAGNQLVLLVNDHDQGSGSTHVDINKLLDGLVQAVHSGTLRQKDVDLAAYQNLKLRATLPVKK